MGCLQTTDIMRIFVTGGAGVIGRELVPRLIDRGHELFVGDLKPCPAEFSNLVSYREGDLNEIDHTELVAFSPHLLIHLAATFERSTENYDFWNENYQHNINLSHHLMTLIKDSDSINRVVFASSYLIYSPVLYQFDTPQTEAILLSEESVIAPRNLTGMAKLAHEIELDFLQNFRSKQFTCLSARIFRGYGKNSRDVISRWIRLLLAGQPIEVYRPEGIFDFIYAADTAEGLTRLALDTNVNGVLNLGTGSARKISDVINILRQHFPEMMTNNVKTDIAYEASEANISRTQSVLNWRPEYSLEKAIPMMIENEKKELEITPAISTRNVLITSASKRKIPMIQAVKHATESVNSEISIIAGDINPIVPSRYVADAFWVMPAITESALPALIDGCHERKIDLIIPTRDGELIFWARHAEELLDAGIKVVVSSQESISRCIDKLAFSCFGVENNLPIIVSKTSLEEIQAKSFVVKERYGAGAENIGINLDRENALIHARNLREPIYQPFVTGKEISIDAYLDVSGAIKGLVMRNRNFVEDGEATITTTFRDEQLEDKFCQVLKALDLRGPVVIQAFIDDEISIQIVECNPRFGGASTAGIKAGLRPFYWAILEAEGRDIRNECFHRSSREVTQIRIPHDIYTDDNDF